MRLGRRRATRQGAPAKAWFATVAKPSSSTRRASSRCAIRSDGGSSRSTACTQKQCTRRPPGDTSSAPPSPSSQTPSSPCWSASPVSRWSSRSSWPSRSAEQALGDGLAGGQPRLRAGPLRPDHARASEGVQLRDDPGVRQRGQRDRGGERLEPDHPHARADERHRVQERPGMPDARPAAQPARVRGLAPRDRGELGKGLVCAHPPAIGRRMITRSASRGSSRTCVALPGPSGTVPMYRDPADRRTRAPPPRRRRRRRGPLGERRMTRLIHPDESCHGLQDTPLDHPRPPSRPISRPRTYRPGIELGPCSRQLSPRNPPPPPPTPPPLSPPPMPARRRSAR